MRIAHECNRDYLEANSLRIKCLIRARVIWWLLGLFQNLLGINHLARETIQGIYLIQFLLQNRKHVLLYNKSLVIKILYDIRMILFIVYFDEDGLDSWITLDQDT